MQSLGFQLLLDKMESVVLSSMIGVRSGVSGGLSYLDDSSVQYVCGRNVVRFETDTRTQRILHGSLESLGITAVATGTVKQK